jgi:hypothetical protein
LLLIQNVRPESAPATGPPDEGPDRRHIRLKTSRFDPLVELPEFPDLPLERRYPEGVRGAYLVQFDRPIRGADRVALQATGARVKGYVPMMTLEVVMTEAIRARVERISGIRWIGVHQPGFKIRRELLDRYGPPFDPGAPIRLQVNLFPGEAERGKSELRGLGARIFREDAGRSYELVEIEIPAGRLQALARVPVVRYIEEVYERVEHNDRSRFHTGLTSIADDTFSSGIDPSLDGFDETAGFQVKYGHFDGGMSRSHVDFQPAISNGWITFEPGADDSDSDSGHGTHTSGSIVGDGGLYGSVPEVPPMSGAISPNRWRGVQPQAALHHISFDNNYTDRQIFERESEEGAHISSNSWGYQGQFGSITDYNSNTAVWDEGVWDADDDQAGLQPLTVFFSAGNNGGFNSPYNGCVSDGPDNIGTPGTAKNVITVGSNETDRGFGGQCGSFSALGDRIEEMNASSSRGPVDPDGSGQGLFKPDVTNIGGYWVMSVEAFGTASACDVQFVEPDCPTDCSNTGPNYAYQNGTSMSTPLTAGLGGVLFQDLVVNRGVAAPKPSLIKALLINGARDLTPSACNYSFHVNQSIVHEGWGFVQAPESLYGDNGTPVERNIDFENEVSANAVATGQTYQRQIEVRNGQPLKVTLVWTDFPAVAGSGSPLVVNDLDLEVSGPDGLFFGNNFAGNWSNLGTVRDRYNVVENVYILNPAGGTYTITVSGFQVSQDQEPDQAGVNQDFSLVWSSLFVRAVCDDGVCEGTESGCNCPEDCGPPPTMETVCDDGIDEDCDSFTDCADQDCAGQIFCLSVCGDGSCQPGEDCLDCPGDCISGSGASCGNGICETADGEDCIGCPEDCNGESSGPPGGRFCCGPSEGCTDLGCITGGFDCTEVSTPGFCCGDASCDAPEDFVTCDLDCGIAAGIVPDGDVVAGVPLMVTADPSGDLILNWTSSCVATDTDYEIYQGTIGDFTSHTPRTCTTGGATTATLTAGSDAAYFIVVPRNNTREGSHGYRSDGFPRLPGPSVCLQPETGVCE